MKQAPARDWEGELRIDSLAAGGAGVGRLPDGRVALIHGVIEGEVVHAAVRGRDGGTRVLGIVAPSNDRVEPSCVVARACGGCDWMHIAAPRQAQRHATIVADVIEHATGARPAVVAHPAPRALGYRTRARFVARGGGRPRVGYRAAGSHDMVAVERCDVARPELLEAARVVAGWLQGARAGAEISVALGFAHPDTASAAAAAAAAASASASAAGGAAEVALPPVVVVDVVLDADPPPSFWRCADESCRADPPPEQGFTFGGVRVSVPGAAAPSTFGDPRGVQRGFDGLPLRIAAGGFAQPSDEGAALLAERVRALAAPQGRRVFELFAGSGTLSVALAAGAASFTSVEHDRTAVACARENLDARDLAGTLRVGDAETSAVPNGMDVVVLDPPRTGALKAIVAAARAKPKRIVYVSCDPPTLARDLKAAAKEGFVVTAVETIELFPQTSHVETIAVLERRPKGSAR